MKPLKEKTLAIGFGFCVRIGVMAFLVWGLVCAQGFAVMQINDPCSESPENCGGGSTPPPGPGFPRSVAPGTNPLRSSAVIANLGSDPQAPLMAVVMGSSQNVYIWRSNGTPLIPKTPPVLSTDVSYGLFNNVYSDIWGSSPAIKNVVGDRAPEIAVTDYGGGLYIWKTSGEILWDDPACPGYGSVYRCSKYLNVGDRGDNIESSPVLTDLEVGGGTPVVFVATKAGRVYAWYANDTGIPIKSLDGVDGRFAATGAESSIYSTPAVGDLDNDGYKEVVVATTRGEIYAWKKNGDGFLNPDGRFATIATALAPPAAMSKLIGSQGIESEVQKYSSPVIADLDGDGKSEVILGTDEGKVYAWRSVDLDGSGLADNVAGWPITATDPVISPGISPIISSVAVADLDKKADGLEVVAATINGTVYVFYADGRAHPGHPSGILPGWPKPNGSPVSPVDSSPILADINNDGIMEIVVVGHNGAFHAWQPDGTPVAVNTPVVNNPPIPIDVGPVDFSTPVLGDLNGNNGLWVAVGSTDNNVYAYPIMLASANNAPWPKFAGDFGNSGNYVRKPVFGDNFNSTIDPLKWTVLDRVRLSSGKAVFEGDGTAFRSDGLSSRKKFDRNKNMVFVVGGVSFTNAGPGFNIVLGSGRNINDNPIFENPSFPFRKMWLSMENGVFRLRTKKGIDAAQIIEDSSVDPAHFPTGGIPTVGKSYSFLVRWLGDPSETNKRVELYLYETAKGLSSATGPIHSFSFTDVNFPIDWDPGIGMGVYWGNGTTSVDSVTLYGLDGTLLDYGVPVINESTLRDEQIFEVFPGGIVDFVALDTFSPGRRHSGDPLEPNDTAFAWATHSGVTGWVPWNTGHFTWNIPRNQAPGYYYFSARSISTTGLMDSKRFYVHVNIPMPTPERCNGKRCPPVYNQPE